MTRAHALPDSVRSVECAVADFTSVARGKIVARADFDAMGGCRLPSAASCAAASMPDST
ncbi:hypothetical protein [Sphaerotilus sulfidivorans]|uniref:hypothetical protein n=1 Tax=Sphaerotilus sulfidivorans TaxID=639200 RepID=UPI0015D9C872|nr:hypothetical protein [Sphaerotilus sulfidivorans]NZD47877.1 hypothetical protein [Sphaerotilus sulfidivorans]